MRNYLTQTLLLFTSVISLYILVQLANLTLRQQNTELMALAVRATVAARQQPNDPARPGMPADTKAPY